RAEMTPFRLYTSIQSLSLISIDAPSSSFIHTVCHPLNSVDMFVVSVNIVWMPHLWCGVKYLTLMDFPLLNTPCSFFRKGPFDKGGKYKGNPSPKSNIIS